MVTYNIKTFASTILGLGIGTYILIFLFTQDLNSIDLRMALTHISTTISINTVIWIFFIKWGWKCKLFYPWLVPFPNLSGQWVGTIKSNWDNKKLDSIPIEVGIKQTFFHVQVRVKTGESSSYSVSAAFDIDEDRGMQQLFYSYLNTPKSTVRDRSQIHYGSTRFEFDGFDVKQMEGEYWTSRETTGEINITKVQ